MLPINFIFQRKSQVSSVGNATSLLTWQLTNLVSISGKRKRCFPSWSTQTNCWFHALSYSNVPATLPRGKAAVAWSRPLTSNKCRIWE